MTLDASGIAFIKSFEGLRLEAYKPLPGDKWTIGWGHTLGVKKGDAITAAQADELLRMDVELAEFWVNRCVKIVLNQNEFNALVSFQFNCGKLPISTLLKKLNTGDRQGAAKEFDRWVYFHDENGEARVEKDLVERRAKEKALFLTRIGS